MSLRSAAEAVLSGDYERIYRLIGDLGRVPKRTPADCDWEGGDLCGFEDVINARLDLQGQLLEVALSAPDEIAEARGIMRDVVALRVAYCDTNGISEVDVGTLMQLVSDRARDFLKRTEEQK